MIKTNIFEQKMHSFIHFREVSGHGRVITPFDSPSLSKHNVRRGSE